MQWGRVKFILILILLLVDGFLLSNLAGRQITAYRRNAVLERQTEAVLAREQVSLAETFKIPSGATLPDLQQDRSKTGEQQLATALLGEAGACTEEPDGSRTWNGANGTVSISANSEIGAKVSWPIEKVPDTEKELKRLAEQIAESLHITTLGGEFTCEQGAVVLRACVAGAPVFNRALTFTFEQNTLSLQGLWPLEMPYTTTRSEAYYDGADALISFALAVKEPTTVHEMQLGYLLQNEVAGQLKMTPCWQIQTDAGEVYLDASKKSIIVL